jgi:hypothetical protein
MDYDSDQKHDFHDLESRIDSSDTVHRSDQLPGAEMGRTVQTVLDCTEIASAWVIRTSTHDEVPFPIGAVFTVTSLPEAAELLDTLGATALSDIKLESENRLHIGYRFD